MAWWSCGTFSRQRTPSSSAIWMATVARYIRRESNTRYVFLVVLQIFLAFCPQNFGSAWKFENQDFWDSDIFGNTSGIKHGSGKSPICRLICIYIYDIITCSIYKEIKSPFMGDFPASHAWFPEALPRNAQRPQRTPCDVVKVAWAPVGTGAGALLLTGGSDGRVQASKIGEVVGVPMEPQKGWLFFRYFVWFSKKSYFFLTFEYFFFFDCVSSTIVRFIFVAGQEP